MAFLTELATNASQRGVKIVLYSGNDDSLISHRSTEGEQTDFLQETCTQC